MFKPHHRKIYLKFKNHQKIKSKNNLNACEFFLFFFSSSYCAWRKEAECRNLEKQKNERKHTQKKMKRRKKNSLAHLHTNIHVAENLVVMAQTQGKNSLRSFYTFVFFCFFSCTANATYLLLSLSFSLALSYFLHEINISIITIIKLYVCMHMMCLRHPWQRRYKGRGQYTHIRKIRTEHFP